MGNSIQISVIRREKWRQRCALGCRAPRDAPRIKRTFVRKDAKGHALTARLLGEFGGALGCRASRDAPRIKRTFVRKDAKGHALTAWLLGEFGGALGCRVPRGTPRIKRTFVRKDALEYTLTPRRLGGISLFHLLSITAPPQTAAIPHPQRRADST